MDTSKLVTLKFKSRNATNPCDKGLAEQYNNGGPFDVELQTTDGKSVSAHRFVLAIFSKSWANALRTVGLDGVIALPIAETYHVAKKLIELLYLREINVLEEEKQPILNALKLLKISGVDDGPIKVPQMPPPWDGQQMQQMVVPAKIQQRRLTVAGGPQTHAPAKRTAQRLPSIHPDQLREHNMQPPPPQQQRPLNMNVAQNPNRSPMNAPASFKVPSHLTISKVKGPVNGAQTQSTQVRQQVAPQQQPPPPTQGQMVPQNRQPTQNQLAAQNQQAALNLMQSRGLIKQSPAGPPKSANVRATPTQAKISTLLPSSITCKAVPRNNQQQHQPQQQSAVRPVQTQPELTMTPIASNHTEEKSAAPAAATVQNGQISENDRIEDEIDDLPIDMDIDETIGNGKTNEDNDNGVEQMTDNGGDEIQSKEVNGMDDAGFGETVADANNNNVEGQHKDQIDHDDIVDASDDEFNDFDGENFLGYDDAAINNSNNIEHHDMHNVSSDMQSNETQ